jgi:hypothetical protein
MHLQHGTVTSSGGDVNACAAPRAAHLAGTFADAAKKGGPGGQWTFGFRSRIMSEVRRTGPPPADRRKT